MKFRELEAVVASQGGCYSRTRPAVETEFDKEREKWFKTALSQPAGLVLSSPPRFPPSSIFLSLSVHPPSPSSPLTPSLFLSSLVYMHRPREERQQGVVSWLPLAFRCGLCGGCFLPLWTYPIDSLRPPSSSLRLAVSFAFLRFRPSFSTVAYYRHGSAFSSLSVNPRRHLLIQINHSWGSPPNPRDPLPSSPWMKAAQRASQFVSKHL